jgi:outer membrane immunogenic protein
VLPQMRPRVSWGVSMRMRKLLAGSVAAVVFYGSLALIAGTASKAAGPTIFDWTGFYIGGHAGYVWNDPTARFAANFPQSDLPTLPFGTAFHPRGDGPLGGFQAGFNFQTGSVVFGLEADWSWIDAKGSTFLVGSDPALGNPPGYTYSTAEKLNSLATLRARFGFTPSDRLLIFVTGGLAYGEVLDSSSLNIAAGGGIFYTGSHSSWRTGWTVGGGGEYALSDNWLVKLEYLYYDLGSQTVIGPRSPAIAFPYATQTTFNTIGHIIRIGMNYKFSTS